MAKKCPKCGTMNDDEMVFCGACTEPLNDDVKLVMRVDEMAKEMREHNSGNRSLQEAWEREHRKDHAPTGARTAHEEEAKHLNVQKKEKEGSAMPLILLGIVAAIAIVFLLK